MVIVLTWLLVLVLALTLSLVLAAVVVAVWGMLLFSEPSAWPRWAEPMPWPTMLQLFQPDIPQEVCALCALASGCLCFPFEKLQPGLE